MSKKDEKIIILTVEEAEKLMKLLDLCEYWLTNNNISYDCNAWASLIEERIAQAEMDEFPFYKNIQEIADYIKREKEQ